MDIRGFEIIKKTFEQSPVGEVEITPEPKEGEDVRFITIRPLDRTRPAGILNVLNEAKLIYDCPRDIGRDEEPLLDFKCVDAFALTLEDKNAS